jgi:hypothetical protein
MSGATNAVPLGEAPVFDSGELHLPHDTGGRHLDPATFGPVLMSGLGPIQLPQTGQ